MLIFNSIRFLGSFGTLFSISIGITLKQNVMKTQQNRTGMAKTAAIVILAGATAFLGWDTYRAHHKSAQLQEQVVEMKTQLDYSALEAQSAMEAFAEIEINLAEIRESEGYLMNNLSEEFDGENNSHKRILNEISAIESLIGANKNLIAKLENEVGEKDSRLKKYKNSVVSLEKRIADYKNKTEKLVAQSEKLKKDLVTVQEQNTEITRDLTMSEMMLEEQAAKLEEKEKQLRTVYYVTGPFKYLKEIDVAEKEGGILGIAAAKTVKDDLNRQGFTAIDKYHYTTIPIYGKNAKLLSNHAAGTYSFVTTDNGDVRWLNITDPERFWENTKYLVVETKGAYYEEQTAQAK